MNDPSGFVPPPYPYDRLDRLVPLAKALAGGIVDLSIGTPCDPPTAEVLFALGHSDSERGYPASIGGEPLRAAIRGWLHRRFDVEVPLAQLAACVGTKEFVATTPHYLRLRTPARDTVLYPAISYPSYAMGATLAGCRAVPVPVDDHWRLDVSAIDPADAARALCLWSNTPGNPCSGGTGVASYEEDGTETEIAAEDGATEVSNVPSGERNTASPSLFPAYFHPSAVEFPGRSAAKRRDERRPEDTAPADAEREANTPSFPPAPQPAPPALGSPRWGPLSAPPHTPPVPGFKPSARMSGTGPRSKSGARPLPWAAQCWPRASWQRRQVPGCLCVPTSGSTRQKRHMGGRDRSPLLGGPKASARI